MYIPLTLFWRITMIGFVEWFEPKKGYGFISTKQNTSSIFFHRIDFINLDNTKKGEQLHFEITPGEKGLKAINIFK